MKNGTILKTFFLFINLIGLSAIGYFQWTNLNLKKKGHDQIQEMVETFSHIWDKETGRSFEEDKSLNLTENAVPLEMFVANLAQDQTSHFITLYPIIKFSKGDLRRADFEKVLPKIRETFLDVLNEKDKDDLLKKDGFDKLKEELVRELNKIPLPLEIEKVYFSSAVVT